jgi:glycerophosphoryl diester phosphodiesterase
MTWLGHGDIFHRASAILRGLLRPGIPAASAEGPCLVIAHRGAARFEAENTIPAFRRALELGADTVEADVSVTSDGRFALWHDADPDERIALARQLGAEKLAYRPDAPELGSRWRRPVRELTASELERHYGYVPDEAAAGGERGRPGRVPIAWLEDLVDFAARERLAHVVLDIKLADDQTAAAGALVARLRELGGGKEPARVFHLLCPQEEIVRALASACAEAGSPPSLRVSADLELPAPSIDELTRTGARDVSLGLGGRVWPGYRRDVGRMLRARDAGHFGALIAWTVNPRRRLEQLVRAGADGVLTDEPALLRQIVESTGRAVRA